MASNPLHLSLFELYTAFRSERLSAGDLTEQAIEQHRTTLGAYKYWQPQDARNAAARADTSFSAGEDHGPLQGIPCLLYTSPSPRDGLLSRMPSSA